jgi:hypothetical protein
MEAKSPKPLLAYAVTEEFEGTGGIVFATSSIAARRIGADKYADGEFENARARRAPYADEYAGSGIVPASRLIIEGWNFECSHCERRLDNDALWERDIKPQDVVGTQDTSVYCNEECEASEAHSRARRKVHDRRWKRRLSKFVKARFPEAVMVEEGAFRNPHIYAQSRNRRLIIRDAVIPFTLPCLEHAPASLVVERSDGRANHPRSKGDGTRQRPIFYTCHPSDKDAFEAYMRDNPPRR